MHYLGIYLGTYYVVATLVEVSPGMWITRVAPSQCRYKLSYLISCKSARQAASTSKKLRSASTKSVHAHSTRLSIDHPLLLAALIVDTLLTACQYEAKVGRKQRACVCGADCLWDRQIRIIWENHYKPWLL